MKKLFLCMSILLFVFGVSATAIATPMPWTFSGSKVDSGDPASTIGLWNSNSTVASYLRLKAGSASNRKRFVSSIIKLVTNRDLKISLHRLRIKDERAPVSEPGTMLLLGAGLIVLAGFGRKKILKKNES